MEPEIRTSNNTVSKEEVNGHDVVFKSEGYLHIAGYIDGEKVVEDKDNHTWVKEQTRLHARYLPNND